MRSKKHTDLTGQKFGRLTVKSFSRYDKTYNYSRGYWSCVCDCGSEVEVRRDHLTRGRTRSCGCLHSDMMKDTVGPRIPVGEASFNSLYVNYRAGAKSRDLDFFLSKEDFRDIITQSCFYCGDMPSQIKKLKGSYGIFVYNGIDRLDNNIGYELGNVVACCGKCNRAKMDLSVYDFMALISKIYSRKENILEQLEMEVLK